MAISRTVKEFARHVLHVTGVTGFRKHLSHLQHSSLQDRFSAIYDTGLWQHGDAAIPLSGGGSSLEATKSLRTQLPQMLQQLGVKSILDVGCGDFTWMSTVDLGDIAYTGIDIVPSVIADNTARHSGDGRRFAISNTLEDELPYADVVLCREVLFHLSLEDAQNALRSFVKSGARHLLLTSDAGTLFNSDIASGDYRLLNLRRRPFNFPAPLSSIDEDRVAGRFIGCWDAATVASRIG